MTATNNPRRVTLTFDILAPGDAELRRPLGWALEEVRRQLDAHYGELPRHLTLLQPLEPNQERGNAIEVHTSHAFLDAPMDTDPTQLRVLYRQDGDVLEVEGINYHGSVFRGLGMLPEGALLRLVKREDGVLTIKRENEPQPWVGVDLSPEAIAEFNADAVLARLSSIAAGVTTRRHVEYVLEACMRLKLAQATKVAAAPAAG